MHVNIIPSDPLYQLAIVLVAGIVGGELVALIKLPKVTGWIFTGILLRAFASLHSPYTGLTPQAIDSFGPYMNFVLGYIAFTVGAALHFRQLAKCGQAPELVAVRRGAAHALGGLLGFDAWGAGSPQIR